MKKISLLILLLALSGCSESGPGSSDVLSEYSSLRQSPAFGENSPKVTSIEMYECVETKIKQKWSCNFKATFDNGMSRKASIGLTKSADGWRRN